MAKLTGWKALLVATVIVAVIGAKAWNSRPHFREIDSGTWDVPADGSVAYSFQLPVKNKIEFEITRGEPGDFQVQLIDTTKRDRMAAELSSDLAKDQSINFSNQITARFDQTGSGTIAARNVSLKAGSYELIITNTDPSEMPVEYKIYEFR